MANEKRLVYLEDALAALKSEGITKNMRAHRKVSALPTVDAVSRGVLEQVMWERNVAIEQLEEHGMSFGCIAPDVVKVVRCKDCKKWQPSGSMAGNSEDDLQPIGGCIWANCCRRANDFCSYGERR